MAGWQAQSMRLVWFGGGLETVRADEVFLRAFGIEAETTQRNKVPGPTNPFWGIAAGPLTDRLTAEVQIQPGRVDLLFYSRESEQQQSLTIEVEEGLSFLEGAANALASIGDSNRIAAVAELVMSANGNEDALDRAVQLSGITHLQGDIHDFTFQINRRLPFHSVTGQSMNRLMRWGVGTFQHFKIEVGNDGPNAPFGSTIFVTSVLADLNSVPSMVPLDFAQQLSMYKELGAELLRIAADPSIQRLE